MEIEPRMYCAFISCRRCHERIQIVRQQWWSALSLPKCTPLWQSMWRASTGLGSHGRFCSEYLPPQQPPHYSGRCVICERADTRAAQPALGDETRHHVTVGVHQVELLYVRCPDCQSRHRQLCARALCETTHCSAVLHKLFLWNRATEAHLVCDSRRVVSSFLVALVQRRCCDTL